MAMKNSPAIILFGPTASGKTDLAIKIAKAINGEIINADSRQFYKNMPIITAMPSKEEFAAVKHHLFECLETAEDFSVADYLQMASKAADEIVSRGKIPIFVGGTGFYVKVLQDGISPIPDTNRKILTDLEQKNTDQLYEDLIKVDLPLSKKIKSNDRQRILRALAIFKQTGRTLTDWQKKPTEGGLAFDFINMALTPERSVLYDRINTRASKMLDMGLMKEVEALFKEYKDLRVNSLTSIGFDIFKDYFTGKISEAEAIDTFAQKQRNYAKRQLTWLRNQYKAELIHDNLDETISYLKERIKKCQTK